MLLRKIILQIAVAACVFEITQCYAEDWTRFRGPNGSGIVNAESLIANWSESENIKWKVDLPGFGSSCPIIIGKQLFLTSYSGDGLNTKEPVAATQLTRHLICFDLSSGNKVWQVDVKSTEDEDPYNGFITEHGYASSTLASNGTQLFAFFGKSGLYAFDMKGKELWHQSLGTKSDPAKWGDGSSPILYKDLIIVNAGNVGHALVALQQSDGSEVWRVEDEKFTNCWSTPIVVKVDGHDEIVFSMPGKILALNPEDGSTLWSAKSPLTQTVCASLAEHNGVVFAMGGRAGVGIAIRCGGKGDVSETHTVWQKPLRANIGTPVAFDGNLYWGSGGMVICASCETGEEVYKERLKPADDSAAKSEAGGRRQGGPQGDYASPIVVGDKIVIVARNGNTSIVKAGSEFIVEANNSFANDAGPFNATPAFVDGNLVVRSNTALYCIGKK